MLVGYLRTELTSDARADIEAEHRLTKATIFSGCMKPLIWEIKYVIQKRKRRLKCTGRLMKSNV